jgi:pimeloyl-ACP methyl ester carboxylesterase
MTENAIERCTFTLDGSRVSYLLGGEGSPVLLLHGTFWSRVWSPILPKLTESHAVFALDYPVSAAPKGGSNRKRRRPRLWQTWYCGWRTRVARRN